MSRLDQIYNMLVELKQRDTIVSRQQFEERYHEKMTYSQWEHFRKTFQDCVTRKPNTNFYLVNVTKWQQSCKVEDIKKAS